MYYVPTLLITLLIARAYMTTLGELLRAQKKRERLARKARVERATKRRARPPKFPGWIPTHLSFEAKSMLQLHERNAVKAAEGRVLAAWDKVSVEERLAMPKGAMRSALGTAQAVARADAREDFRRQALAEIEQAAKAKTELPSHIARIDRGSVQDYVDAAAIRPALSHKDH